jgi:serine/threonine protein kinase
MTGAKVPELRLENSVVDDRYLVERCLGRGSYAEIFLSFDQNAADRPSIIKALNTSLQGTPDADLEETLIENFQNEALALDRVRHPHIIRRLGHGTAADLEGVPFHYLVLEYMAGGDLLSLCRKSPLSIAGALFYFQQVAEALAYAHSQHVIHRDIKPNNLLLSSDEKIVKIADFGVAKLTHDESIEITRVGTNVYAPPEHHPEATGESDERLTPSADVYSLAKTVYTAVTGRAPRQFARLPITQLPPELAHEPCSQTMLRVLRKATASRVAERYQSVQEFWEDFARVKSDADDDEATIVRPRLNASSTVEQPASRPNFQTLMLGASDEARLQKARIVVELPGHETPTVAERTGNSAGDSRPTLEYGAQESSPRSSVNRTPASDPRSFITRVDTNVAVAQPDLKQAPTSEAGIALARTRAMREGLDDRTPFDRMRAVLGSNWLRRVFMIFLIVALIGLVTSTYYHFKQESAPWSTIFGPISRDGSTTNNVNLRSDPGGAVLGVLPQGSRVRAFEERSGWLRVRVLSWAGNQPDSTPDAGWIDGKYIKLD